MRCGDAEILAGSMVDDELIRGFVDVSAKAPCKIVRQVLCSRLHEPIMARIRYEYNYRTVRQYLLQSLVGTAYGTSHGCRQGLAVHYRNFNGE